MTRRVLLVDDETLIAMLLEDALTEAGVVVLGSAGSAEVALHILQDALAGAGLDAMVLDVLLGTGDSSALAEGLRNAGVPFLVTTRLADAPERSGVAPGVIKRSHPRSS